MIAIETPLSPSKREEHPLMVMDITDWDPGVWDDGPALLRRLRGLERWAGDAHWQLLSHHKGHIVKRASRGLVMEFADARNCLQAAFALGRLADAATSGGKDSDRLRFRAGAHLATYSRGQNAAADRDMNLTSALTTLAKPGEVLVTAELRDRLADGVDADFEDLGYWVEPLSQPVRLFRAHARQDNAAAWSGQPDGDVRPALAVIPFKASTAGTRRWMIGELIAEGVISRLSHAAGLRVIARQSTSALRGSDALAEIERHLGATFVLSGSYGIQGRKLVVTAELAEARSHTLLWSGQLRYAVDDLLQEDSQLLQELATTVAQALGKTQTDKALARPLPSLDSSFLMLAGVSMTHSHSAAVFERGRMVLIELIERHPQLALPRAWLGLWHTLNVVKGTSGNVKHDTRLAREQTRLAVEAEPGNAMALAVEGYIQCQLLGSPEQARLHLDAALQANPSEPMAWLFKSLYSTMWDSSAAAVSEATLARALSPVDPLGYFFDLLTGNALLADHQHEQAIVCVRRSLRANMHHVPTLRLLLTAQAELGQLDEGRETLGQLMAEVPDLTVSSYLSMGSADSPIRQRIANAMRQLGLPEN